MDKKTFWVIILAAILVIVIIYFAIKPSLIGSPISCYVRCNSNGHCGNPSTTKTCNGTNLCTTSTTYTCLNPGIANASCLKTVNTGCSPCIYGCTSGKCVNETYTCTDSDYGIDTTTRGTTIEKLNGVTKATGIDYCYNISNSTTALIEYFCEANRLNSIRFSCGNWGCSNGACATPQVNYTCTDTDGGLVYTTKGTTTEKLGNTTATGTDVCSSNSTGYLTEYYCSANNRLTSINYYCTSGCSNGVCASGNQTGNMTG